MQFMVLRDITWEIEFYKNRLLQLTPKPSSSLKHELLQPKVSPLTTVLSTVPLRFLKPQISQDKLGVVNTSRLLIFLV